MNRSPKSRMGEPSAKPPGLGSDLSDTGVEADVLVNQFFQDTEHLGKFVRVDAPQIPSPSLELLAHNHHMTVTLEKHHSQPVEVQVLQFSNTPQTYARTSLLRRQTDQAVVQYGIVRLHLDTLTDPVRQEIESRQIPLGRVLINHNVLREVKLLGLFEITCGPELAKWFQCDVGEKCFGRTAIIYFQGVPAVEVLEIVWAFPD